MRKQLAAFALLTALTIPGAAQGAAIVNFTNTTAIPGNNDFQGLLNAHGLTRYATTGGSITLDVASNITFYYMAAESAYNDTFSAVSTPSTRGSRWVPPAPGISPSLTSGSAMLTPGAATR